MPGIILVSVLEFVDLPVSSPSSSISIKISMGKREYQTWDKGEFSFPLTTLRDNLTVVLQNAEGNEISQAGVETKSIVEKGLWDDFFPLKGGGHVHMRLQFVLNEDERNRIRMMRESALKKKRGEPLDCRTSSSVAVATNDSSQVASPVWHMISSDKNKETSSAIDSTQRVDVHLRRIDHRESNEKVEAQSFSSKTPTRAMKSSESNSSRGRRGSLERIPSVKKMISAFETNVDQDMKPQIKSQQEKLQENKIGLELKERKTAVNMKTVQGTSEKLEKLSTVKVRPKSQNDGDNQNSSGASVGENSEADVSLEHSQSSTHDLTSVAEYEDIMGDSFKGSDLWIFPDQLRRFCVTTGGQKLMDLRGGYSIKPEVHKEKTNFSTQDKPKEDGGIVKEVDRSKKSHKVRELKANSEEVKSSGGPVGQAIKVAIIVGFGVLVLFTRQK
ncbi:uncharacterized protein LOC115707077 isoform X2 [Cannabis sativa]|uniref:uncharacterized protein LOC115707077 isoform X2 n=1 Tax=Cannabis sativa TaxID=3483 RepID=UPI0029CA1832|nr:uncharacterized protein LOC115707077 isoform X2 [Cannabis sativa]